MITKTPIHTEGKYTVMFNAQVNAWRPYSVVNNDTGETEFRGLSLGICLEYMRDNAR